MNVIITFMLHAVYIPTCIWDHIGYGMFHVTHMEYPVSGGSQEGPKRGPGNGPFSGHPEILRSSDPEIRDPRSGPMPPVTTRDTRDVMILSIMGWWMLPSSIPWYSTALCRYYIPPQRTPSLHTHPPYIHRMWGCCGGVVVLADVVVVASDDHEMT